VRDGSGRKCRSQRYPPGRAGDRVADLRDDPGHGGSSGGPGRLQGEAQPGLQEAVGTNRKGGAQGIRGSGRNAAPYRAHEMDPWSRSDPFFRCGAGRLSSNGRADRGEACAPETFTWTSGQSISFSPPPGDWTRSRYQRGSAEGVDFVRARGKGQRKDGRSTGLRSTANAPASAAS
jgi:hypothetical protein